MNRKITQEPGGQVFDCAAGDTILRAALRAGLGMPYSCNTGSCGNCRFQLIEGEVRHLRDDAPAWNERELARNRWLGCQAEPLGDCRIKVRLMDQYAPPVRPARQRAELVSSREITPDIREFAFRMTGDLDFRPGQYGLLHIPGIDGPRAYSMSGLPSDGDWRFMVKHAPGGAASGWLFDAAPGTTIEIDGPYGTAYLVEDSPRDIVLLAGGSGLSPMVSIARGAVAAGMLESRKLHLFYGGRRQSDLIEPGTIAPEVAARTSFTAALSEPVPGETWDGPTGYLHEVVRDSMGEALRECEIYFAGPAVMSAAVQKMAHEAGVPPGQLHFDEFY